jgi:hypothetical protein
MAYIYSITNTINEKKYIGKTSQPNPYDRWKQHLQLARSFNNLQENNSALSMPILRAISKYGADNFKFRVIEECNDDRVDERETYWIEKYNTAEGSGYNCTYGGEGISKPRKYWANHPQSKAVSCYTLEGEWVRNYETCGIAADSLGNKKGRNCIRACIKGTTFQAFGYRWSWKGEEPKLVEKRVNRRGAVYGINPTLGRKKMWKSQADAAEEITGKRTSNLIVFQSVNSHNSNKLQAKGWYLFRKKPTNWTPAERKGFTSESAKKAGKMSAEKTRKPIYGVNITTGEIVEFESILAASYFIKGDGNRSGVANIYNNIQRIKNGQTWCYAFGYKWYEKA